MGWVHKAILTPPFFNWSACTQPEKSAVMYICDKGLSVSIRMSVYIWEQFWRCAIFCFSFVLFFCFCYFFIDEYWRKQKSPLIYKLQWKLVGLQFRYYQYETNKQFLRRRLQLWFLMIWSYMSRKLYNSIFINEKITKTKKQNKWKTKNSTTSELLVFIATCKSIVIFVFFITFFFGFDFCYIFIFCFYLFIYLFLYFILFFFGLAFGMRTL
jgi:hypothetical protein